MRLVRKNTVGRVGGKPRINPNRIKRKSVKNGKLSSNISNKQAN